MLIDDAHNSRISLLFVHAKSSISATMYNSFQSNLGNFYIYFYFEKKYLKNKTTVLHQIRQGDSKGKSCTSQEIEIYKG